MSHWVYVVENLTIRKDINDADANISLHGSKKSADNAVSKRVKEFLGLAEEKYRESKDPQWKTRLHRLREDIYEQLEEFNDMDRLGHRDSFRIVMDTEIEGDEPEPFVILSIYRQPIEE